jgi:polyhydroxyalkanoate synthesis regulator protein
MKEFKKYKNRKIYSLETSSYSTVENVAIESLSEEVTVVDSATANDITTDTLLTGFTKLLDSEGKAQLVKLAQQLYLAKGLDQNLTNVAKEEPLNV